MRETLESDFKKPLTPTDREIADLGPWFHNLHLPDGSQTAPDHPLQDFPSYKWEEIAPYLPKNLTGWKILDIGCNAGFYTFELAKRGAEVTAIDLNPHYLKQAKWAAKKFGLHSKIEFRNMQVYDLARTEAEYDLVWFMGVFYHLRYPLLALDLIAQRTRKMLVFQALTMPGEETAEIPESLSIVDRDRLREPAWPKMAFIENRLAGDPTNWWVPNHSCIEAMLRSAGFEISSRPGHEIYICERSKKRRSEPLQKLFEQEFLSAAGLKPQQT